MLLHELLQTANLKMTDLKTLKPDEPSHAAVAQAIASGKADAGLAIQSVADKLGLGFVPLIQENYWLVCLKSAIDSEPITHLRQILKTQKIVLLGYLLIHILIQLLKYIRDKSQLRIYILIILFNFSVYWFYSFLRKVFYCKIIQK